MKYKKNPFEYPCSSFINLLYGMVGYDQFRPRPAKISKFCERANRKFLDINIQLMYMGTGCLNADLEFYTRLIILQAGKKNLIAKKEDCIKSYIPNINLTNDLESVLNFADELIKDHSFIPEKLYINNKSISEIRD